MRKINLEEGQMANDGSCRERISRRNTNAELRGKSGGMRHMRKLPINYVLEFIKELVCRITHNPL